MTPFRVAWLRRLPREPPAATLEEPRPEMDDVAKPPAESPPPLCIRDFMVCSQRAADARHSPASPTGSVEAANEATSCSAKCLPSVAALQQNLKTQPQFL